MNQARLTWIFGIALVIALIVIAFLLGRNSTRVEQVGGPVAIYEPEAPPPPAETPAPPSEPPASKGSVAQVVAYFAKLDAIQAGPAGVSADAFAQQIAAEAAQGKAGGFDRLQGDLERMEGELRALKPPPACQELHELTLSATNDAKLMITDLRRAFGTGDASAASQLAARAQAAQEKTKRIEEMRKSIEIEYGLAR